MDVVGATITSNTLISNSLQANGVYNGINCDGTNVNLIITGNLVKNSVPSMLHLVYLSTDTTYSIIANNICVDPAPDGYGYYIQAGSLGTLLMNTNIGTRNF